MKNIRFSLLSVLFLSLFALHSISHIHFIENLSSSNAEFKIEERKSKISIEDFYILSSYLSIYKISFQLNEHLYRDVIYTFKLLDRLFKPPRA